MPKTPQGEAAPLAGPESYFLSKTALLFWLQAGLTAVMRIAWLWPWLLQLQTWFSPSAQGPLLPFGALLFFILVLALWLLDRRGRREIPSQILAVLVIVAAVLLIAWVIRAGHTGAESVWQGIAQQMGG